MRDLQTMVAWRATIANLTLSAWPMNSHYVFTRRQSLPKEEMYGLRSQLRRAAVSIPTNIVEGCARESEGDLLRFLDISFASTREVNYLVDLASRLRFIDAKTAADLVHFGGRVAAALAALRKSYS